MVHRLDDLCGPQRLARSRRAPRPLRAWDAVVPLALLVLLVATLAGVVGLHSRRASDLMLLISLGLMCAAAISLGPWLVALTGYVAMRRRGPLSVLVARRLIADPRTPGRVAGVLLGVGLAVGVAAGGIGSTLDMFAPDGSTYGGDLMFYLAGYLMALAGIGLAALVAALCLVVGAGEQVLDAARPTAALVAMGAPVRTVLAVQRQQLLAAAVAPAVVGALAGWTLITGLVYWDDRSVHVGAAVSLPMGIALAGLTAAAGAGLAARLLRSTVVQTASVESLRTP